MSPLPIAILGSGAGTNCGAILQRIEDGRLSADARIVVSDQPGAGILEIAQRFSVAAQVLPPGKYRTRLETTVEQALVRTLRGAGVELVVLAGFMRILKEPMLKAFPRRIINIHPSLLPKYPGLAAWAQALSAGETVTGCTVHYVDGGVDTGEILGQREVPVLPNDTPVSLHARIQEAERDLYPEMIEEFARNPRR